VALTGKQAAFVEHYIACGFNATRAAELAGYANAPVEAYRTIRKDRVKRAINERFAEVKMDASEALARLARWARDDDPKTSLKALELIGKNLRILTDRVEVDDVSALSDEELAARISAVSAKIASGGTRKADDGSVEEAPGASRADHPVDSPPGAAE
jgi:phage terminase small subunit